MVYMAVVLFNAVFLIVPFNLVLLGLAFLAWRLLRRSAKDVGVEASEQTDSWEPLVADGGEVSASERLADLGPAESDAVSVALHEKLAAQRAASAVANAGVTAEAGGPNPLGASPSLDLTGGQPEPQRRRFVPGGIPMDDGSIPDFTMAYDHLFAADNGVRPLARRRSRLEPVKLSIQAGARPITPLLERVLYALENIGLEPAQSKPMVHSFSDSAGRAARVKLTHDGATGDAIQIEVEPSLSPAAMASVMELLSDLTFDPGDAAGSTSTSVYGE